MRIFRHGSDRGTGTASGFRRVPAATALHRYGMTGSVGDAEDVAQDAFPGLTRARQAGTTGTTITDPEAYLTTVLSRLGINYLRSARVRRETYVGDWLPEPVVPAGGSPKIPPAWHLRGTPARGAGS
jgi:DNA-directed RNA polymerase specialized sigma24 family protein